MGFWAWFKPKDVMIPGRMPAANTIQQNRINEQKAKELQARRDQYDTVWIAQRDETILCTAYTKDDILGAMREFCQFVNILTENPNQITATIKYKQHHEQFFVKLTAYPIRKPKPC